MYRAFFIICIHSISDHVQSNFFLLRILNYNLFAQQLLTTTKFQKRKEKTAQNLQQNSKFKWNQYIDVCV